MKTLVKAVHAVISQRKHWEKELNTFLKAYRATPHQSTGVASSMALNNRKLNVGFPSVKSAPTLAETIRNKVIGNDEISKANMWKYADVRRTRESGLEVGETVLLKNISRLKMDPPNHLEPR